MESLLKVVKKSPRPFSRSSASKHKKLSENWGEKTGSVKGDGVSFYVKYLGSTLVEEIEDGESYGDNISAHAVQTIVNMAKMSGKKLAKMCITVSSTGIKVVNMLTKDSMADFSIYRICFCTADKSHDKVFAYIARNTDNETMECQAFLCPKKKIAQAVTLTVAQSFSSAQDEWEEKERKDRENHDKKALSQSSNQFEKMEVKTKDIIDLSDPPPVSPRSQSDSPYSPQSPSDSIHSPPGSLQTPPSSLNLSRSSNTGEPIQSPQSLGFDDDFNAANLDDDFSCLAQSRLTSPQSNTTSQPDSQHRNPFSHFATSLCVEDLEAGVQDLLSGSASGDSELFSALTRQPSIDDLLNL